MVNKDGRVMAGPESAEQRWRKVKKVGHEMESSGNSAEWKGDDVGKVRKAPCKC